MSEWRKVKLNGVLKHKKGNIKIDDETEYKLCRVQLHRRGVLLRGMEFGYQIKTKKQQVCQAGDLIVAEMDAKFGGYGFIPEELENAIVSSHYYLYELDKTQISQDYFQTLISTDYIQNQIEAKGSTNYSSIRAKEFLEYEIPLPSLPLQAEISKRFLTFSDFKTKLIIETTRQQTYFTKLRKAILQEAIEGKLTADWRVKNPVEKGNPNTDAAALLATIKTEKQRLIAEGKIKKEKPLAPINTDGVPFALPDGWVWVRLGNICQIKGGKRVSNGYKLLKTPTPYIYIRVSDMKNGTIDNSDIHYIDANMYELIKNYTISKDDLYMTIVGATIGKCGIVPDKFHNMNLTENAAKITPYFISKLFLLNCLSSNYCQNQFIDKTKQVGVQKMALNRFETTLIPLPPLAEQQALVEQIDRFLASVTALEQQVQARKTYAEQLMQAVLKEAFTEQIV